jgi:hypothetical protein
MRLLAQQIVHLISKSQHFQTIFQSLCRIIDVLAHAAAFNQCFLLLCELLRRGLDGAAQLHDLRSQTDCTLANILKLVHTGDEFLVVGIADALDLGFTFARDLVECLYERLYLCLCLCILEQGY